MPQMMPMTWLIMMMFFIINMLMFSSFLYFFISPLIPPKLLNTYNKFNWNWLW